MVATFLAILSLAKDKKITLTQTDDDFEVEMIDSDSEINFDVEDDYTNDNE